MSAGGDSVSKSTVQAGAGRPFRFSLVLGEGEGLLLSWLGGRWAFLLGATVVSLFASAGALVAALQDSPAASFETFLFAGAGMGALAVALHLRPRRFLFRLREGTWWWRERRFPVPAGWAAITEEAPLRLERDILQTMEGFTLYAGTVRLFSYLGEPSIGRDVTAAFQAAGVPLRTVIRRREERE